MPQKKKVTKKQYPDPSNLKGLATRDDLLHGKLTFDPVPSHKDTRISDRKSWKPTGGHPAGVSEGPVEQAVKSIGGRFGSYLPEEDNPYLEQYFHPDQNILEKQDLRPTVSSGKNENLPYRKLAIEKINGLDTEHRKVVWDELDKIAAKYGQQSKEWGDAYNKIENKPKMKDYGGFNLLGLGHYTEDKSNPNYDSIYDEWDFDTESTLMDKNAKTPGAILPSLKEYIAKTFMKNAGTPYAVYDRTPKGTDFSRVRVPLQGLSDKR